MATDPVTSPTTKVGQILYGLGLGILTVIFRYLTPYPEGVLTSILTMNMFVFICDKLGSRAMYHKCYQSSIIVMVILGLLGGYTVALRYQVTETIDSDYHILEKKIQGSVAEYVVTQKGYGGTIKASIKVQNGKVIQYTILEHNETFYQKVEAQNYIETLLDTQDPTIDAVSGATVTSTALKKMMQNTLEDYRKSHVEQSDTTLEIEKPKPIEKVTITDIERFDTEEIYHVTTKSFGGEIRLLVTVQEDKITNIEVVEQKDSYFFKVEEQDYIEKLIEQQDGLESLDTVSGATVSSTALKDAIMRVIEESRNDHEG